jgi:hypothetical protein
MAVGDPGSWFGRTKLDSSSPGPPLGRPQHDDVTAGAGDADDGVHELALHERPALDLEAQPDEERRHRVEVRDGDADMVETSYVRHEVAPPDLLVS